MRFPLFFFFSPRCRFPPLSAELLSPNSLAKNLEFLASARKTSFSLEPSSCLLKIVFCVLPKNTLIANAAEEDTDSPYEIQLMMTENEL